MFSLSGIDQVVNDIQKCVLVSKEISLTKSTAEFQCELRYFDKIYLYIRFLQGLVLRASLVCTSIWISCWSHSFASRHDQDSFVIYSIVIL